jgi:hypothetical protein
MLQSLLRAILEYRSTTVLLWGSLWLEEKHLEELDVDIQRYSTDFLGEYRRM